MNIHPIIQQRIVLKYTKMSPLPDFFLYVYIKIVCMHTHKQMSMNLPVTKFHKALK